MGPGAPEKKLNGSRPMLSGLADRYKTKCSHGGAEMRCPRIVCITFFAVLISAVVGSCFADPAQSRISCAFSGRAIEIAVDAITVVLAETDFQNAYLVIGPTVPEKFAAKHSKAELPAGGFRLLGTQEASALHLAVVAETPVPAAYGTFHLKRIMGHTPDRLDNLDVQMSPVLPIREYYEEHGWEWPEHLDEYKSRLDRYLEEGINRLDLPVAWWFPPPEYLIDPKPYQDQVDRFVIVREVISYAHQLGIEVHLVNSPQFNPFFQVSPDNLEGIDKETLDGLRAELPGGVICDYMFCPTKPLSRELVGKSREIVFRELPEADGIVEAFGDPGYCLCSDCGPNWGGTVLRTVNEFFGPLLEKTGWTNKSMTLSLWGLHTADTTWLVEHQDQLPSFVDVLQIPPTRMDSPPLLTYDQGQIDAIHGVRAPLKVVEQQFFDGVGFLYGWVHLFEHPMPARMERHFRACLDAEAMRGTYGSSFEIAHQLVDTRLMMTWAWQPDRSAEDILKEYGDEQFGHGAGPGVAAALFEMEKYWDLEFDRFFGDSPGAADEPQALQIASTALASLQSARPYVRRATDDFFGFSALAEAMVSTSSQYIQRASAEALLMEGRREEAEVAARDALWHAERTIEALLSSERYAFLQDHPWYKENWQIAQRPERIRELIQEIASGATWEQVHFPGDEFGPPDWKLLGGLDKYWTTDPDSGKAVAVLTGEAGAAYSLVASPPISVTSGAGYKVRYDAKVAGGSPMLYLDWCSGLYDGANVPANLDTDGSWHTYSQMVTAPGPDQTEHSCMLRFVVYGQEQEIHLKDVVIFQRVLQTQSSRPLIDIY